MLILPAIDIRGGKCVRLAQGDYDRETVYGANPVEIAHEFAAQGAEWIHVVDLDGAKTGDPINLSIVAKIVRETGVRIEFGGGIRSRETGARVLDAGVARVVVGTKLVEDPELSKALFAEFGERIVAGIDCRDGMVATDGWRVQASVSAIDLGHRLISDGATRVILTDIAMDGMLTGPNLNLLAEFSRQVPLRIIQSGGISSVADVIALAQMKPLPPEGVIIGRAIYEGRLKVDEAIAAAKS